MGSYIVGMPTPSDITTPAEQLRQLSDVILDIADTLESSQHGPGELAKQVRSTIAARSGRQSIISGDVFSDPAWDILLALFLANVEGRHMSVTDLCAAASVPTSTALRWIALLEKQGAIVRTANTEDARKANLGLSGEHAQRMRLFFNRSETAMAAI